MEGINLVFGCGEEKVCFPNYPTAPGKDKAVVIALAFVEKGGLVAEDITEADIAAGTTPTEDIIAAVRKLQKLNQAVYFPSGHVSGSKPRPTEITDNNIYGLRIDAKTTGEVTNSFVIRYEYSHATQNVRYFNWLRKNTNKYDAVVWTDKSVYIIENYELDFYEIGHELTGNANETVTGGFSFRYLADGEPVPYPYSNASALKEFTTLSFSPPVLTPATDNTIAAAACKNKCTRYAATYETGGFSGTIAYALNEDVDVTPCVTWELHKNCGKSPLDPGVSINPTTGVITFASFNTAGVNQYTVVAYNDSCVVGEVCFEIVATVAP